MAINHQSQITKQMQVAQHLPAFIYYDLLHLNSFMGHIVFYNECAQLLKMGSVSSFLQFLCTLATSKQCILRICQN